MGKTQNLREKLNLRGAVSPPVASSGVTKKAWFTLDCYPGYLPEFNVNRPLRLDLCQMPFQTPLVCATIGNIPVLTGLATLTFWSWGCLEKYEMEGKVN